MRQKTQPGNRHTPPAPVPDRLPPHSIEAEQGLLGCILLESAPACEALAGFHIGPAHFFDLRHRELFEELMAMHAAGRIVDLIVLQERLKKKKRLQELGGVSYLSQLADAVPSAANLSYYADIVREKYLLRRLLATVSRIEGDIFSSEAEPAVFLAQAEHELGQLIEEREAEKGLLEIVSHKNLLDYVPPSNLCLVGENHINRGSLFVIGGPPGCGKSRLTTTLAVAGSRGKGNWMGYAVKHKFKTLILQSENGLYRLKEEFSAVPASAEEFVRVCAPPPCGLAFKKPEFRAAVKKALRDFPADVVVIDPWNAVAAEEGQSDYVEAFEAIMACLPHGDAAPALGIVAHMRKPKTEGMAHGRGMLNELSGSLVIGSRARSVFFLLPGSDDVQDDRVVFCCRKNNDGDFGADSAWFRRNGEFAPCADFDFNEFWTPAKGAARAIEPELLKTILDGGKRWLALNKLVEEIMEEGDFGRSAAYGATKRFKDNLTEKDGLLTWKG